MKKVLCLVCIILMMMPLFAGCVENPAATKTEPTTTETEMTVTTTETEMTVTTPETEMTVTTTAPPPPEEEWRSDAEKKYNINIHNYYEYRWLEEGNTP